MQRDTDLALEDIEDNILQLIWRIASIQSTSLEENSHSQWSRKLRFISYSAIEDTHDPSETVLHISEPHENPGARNYLAVSYCWDSFGNDEGHESPQSYLMETPAGVRRPRCPASVLTRALLYARSKSIPFIWIDQECINQSEAADKARYVQCMHEIFERSEYAIGLLTSMVNTQAFLADTYLLTHVHVPLVIRASGLRRMARHLRMVRRDRWFSRTWTLQEKMSAKHLVLLLPHDPSLTRYFGMGDIGAAIEISLTGLSDGMSRWDGLFHANELECLAALHQIGDTIADMHGFTEHRIVTPEQNEINPGRDLSRVLWSGRPLVCRTFSEIERCDNRIVSDRLAILSNICHFNRRLDTQILLTQTTSYTLGLLTLLLKNGHIPMLSRIRRGHGQAPLRSEQAEEAMAIVPLPMHVTISELLDGIVICQETDRLCQNETLLNYCRSHWPLGLENGPYYWASDIRFSTDFIEKSFTIAPDMNTPTHRRDEPQHYRDVHHALESEDAAVIAWHWANAWRERLINRILGAARAPDRS